MNDRYKIELNLRTTQYGVCDNKIAVVTMYQAGEVVQIYRINPEDIPNIHVNADADADADADTDPDADLDADTDPDAETDAGTDPDPETDADLESDGFKFTLVMTQFGTFTAVVEVGDGTDGDGDAKATI